MLPCEPSGLVGDLRDGAVVGQTIPESSLEVRFRHETADVPKLQAGGGARSGWTTWLKTGAFESDDSQVVLKGAAA